MVKEDYFTKRTAETIERLNKLLVTLPAFLGDYFLGIENTTSPLTRLNYATDLNIFFDFFAKRYNVEIDEMEIDILDEIKANEIELFLSYLSSYNFNGERHMCNEKAKARKLASVRSMYKFFFNRDMIIANTAAKITTPKLHDKEIIRLESDEISELLRTAETGEGLSDRQLAYQKNTAIRDVALLTLFLGTGIRISELVGLNTEDIFFDNNSFIVTRKGGNKTILYFTDEVKEQLLKWLEVRGEDTKIKNTERALFVSLQGKRISIRAVQNLVKKYAKIVTPLKKITPHKLRSTFGTQLYRETGDIYVVADFLGHKDINTTKKHYAAISDDIRKKAIKKIVLKNDADETDNLS